MAENVASICQHQASACLHNVPSVYVTSEDSRLKCKLNVKKFWRLLGFELVSSVFSLFRRKYTGSYKSSRNINRFQLPLHNRTINIMTGIFEINDNFVMTLNWNRTRVHLFTDGWFICLSVFEVSTASFLFNRSGSNDGSWWQDSDADDEDEEEDQESKPAKSGLDGCSLTPFTNNLCGIVFVEEKLVTIQFLLCNVLYFL